MKRILLYSNQHVVFLKTERICKKGEFVRSHYFQLALVCFSLLTVAFDSSFADPGIIWVTGIANQQMRSGAQGDMRLDSGQKINSQTPFNFASLTKPFTGFLIWQLMREHHISLDTPLKALLPELPAVYARVRVSDLLHHTSGIADYTFACDGTSTSPLRAKKFLRELRTLEFQPGQAFQYSNSNFLILSWLSERLSKMDFAHALRKWVLLPAGMATAYLRTEVPIEYDAKVAWAYSLQSSGGLVLNTSNPCDVFTGDGGLIGSASDLVAWAKFLSSNLASSTPISELFISGTHGLPGSGSYEYGLGWQIILDAKGLLYQHAGGWLGYRSIFRFRPKSQKWLVVLQNRDDWDIYSTADSIENL